MPDLLARRLRVLGARAPRPRRSAPGCRSRTGARRCGRTRRRAGDRFSPSIVVTSRSPTVWTSVMQLSTGTPSSCTVQAPQWPSAQAIFVPVSPRSSRSVSASVCPTGASNECSWPLTLRLGSRGHRRDVREVNEPERDPGRPRPARSRPRPRGRARQRSRAALSSSRICSVSSRWPFERSSQAFSARPSTPIVSACRIHRSGVAIERYWWMRANVSGCAMSCGPARRRQRQRLLARRDPARAPAEHRHGAGRRRGPPSGRCGARRAARTAATRRGSRRRRAPAPARRGDRGRAGRAGSTPRCRRRRPAARRSGARARPGRRCPRGR